MDSISNMITKIRNASARGIETVSFPYSKITLAIAELLQNEGFIKDVVKKGKKVHKTIEATLVYDEERQPRVTGVERVSKLSKRVYAGVSDIKSVRSGYGVLVLSTPAGLLTDKQARTQKVGGEVLFKIW
ncbi:MAG: 30S ribosomal protein S8 [Candidatus Paceibacterota bacterium]|jgi:small subunit ribosomal protein S8